MPPDEVRVVGQVDIVRVVSTLDYVVKEMERIGNVVEAQGKDASAWRDELKDCIADLRDDLHREIAKLDKAQSLTDRDLKFLIAKISAVVAAVVSIAGGVFGWLVKSGAIAALLGAL